MQTSTQDERQTTAPARHPRAPSRVELLHDVRSREGFMAVSALAKAFESDPVMNWLALRSHRSAVSLADLFSCALVQSCKANLAYVVKLEEGPAKGEVAGGAFWFPPGTTLDLPFSVILRAVGCSRLPRVGRTMSRVEAAHPHSPRHYYLFAVGVDPLAQGQGLSTPLLRAHLAKADAEGMPCYLENSNPSNTPIYEKLGFVSRGLIELKDDTAPPVLAMWREPQRDGKAAAVQTQA